MAAPASHTRFCITGSYERIVIASIRRPFAVRYVLRVVELMSGARPHASGFGTHQDRVRVVRIQPRIRVRDRGRGDEQGEGHDDGENPAFSTWRYYFRTEWQMPVPRPVQVGHQVTPAAQAFRLEVAEQRRVRGIGHDRSQPQDQADEDQQELD